MVLYGKFSALSSVEKLLNKILFTLDLNQPQAINSYKAIEYLKLFFTVELI